MQMVHESEKLQYFSAAETTAKKKNNPEGSVEATQTPARQAGRLFDAAWLSVWLRAAS